MNEPQENGKIDVGLVHGTWAANAKWTQPESTFSASLKELVGDGTTIEPIGWSGRNSARARADGAVKVRQFLRDSKADTKVIIGHSHGGNIGATALHDPQGASDHALITLNTPFLNPVRRSNQVLIFHAILLFVGLVYVVWDAILPAFGSTHSMIVDAVAPLVAVVLIFVGVLLLQIIIGRLLILLKVSPDRFNSYFAQLQDVTLIPETDRTTNVLSISTNDDEALGWLQVAETLLNVPFLLLHRLALPISLVVIGIAHYVFELNFGTLALWTVLAALLQAQGAEIPFLTIADIPLGVRNMSPEKVIDLSQCIWGNSPEHNLANLCASLDGTQWLLTVMSVPGYFILFWLILAVAGLIAAYLIGGVVFGTGFGLKGLVFAFAMRWHVSPVPTSFHNVTLRHIDTESGWLRHSTIYSDRKVQRLVSDWISNLPMHSRVGKHS